ncbi:MAG: YiiD C-terminal domain-containing protein [Pontibacterium sp.]
MRSDSEFLAKLCDDIPLLSHMGLSQLSYQFPELSLHAKFLPNINDKGTGFGGSMATLMTISGWSLVTRLLDAQGLDCDVMIHRSSIEFLLPVHGDFYATASIAETDQPQREAEVFFDRILTRERAALEVAVHLREVGAEHPSCVMLGRYVAIKKQPESSPLFDPS